MVSQLKLPAFLVSIRAKLFFVSLVLLLIPLIGFRFVVEMEGYLRDGQQQVLLSAARFVSASLSERPDLMGRQPVGESASSAEEIEQRRLISVVGNSDSMLAAALGKAYQQSEAIERLLTIVAKDGARIWVVDSHLVVRGLEGNLNQQTALKSTREEAKRGFVTWFQWAYRASIRPLVEQFGNADSATVTEDSDAVLRAVLAQVDRALNGQASVQSRLTKLDSTLVQSAAQPIWLGDNIVGAVVVEESDRGSRSIKAAGLEALLGMTILIFFVGFVALMIFAWRLAFRVRRLRSEAERAIDSHGRITGFVSGTTSRDEIGALAGTLEEILIRLKRYNSYLEQMAARLSHELRTPVAVIRSSLDNLRVSKQIDTDMVYINRADEGIKRLANLISRMSEASQLEQFLQGADRETFDLDLLVAGCLAGYRTAYADQHFTGNLIGSPVLICGVADAIAQLLDKLVQNAIDFATPGTAIVISVEPKGRRLILSVENSGPPLSGPVIAQLFASIVTDRKRSVSQDGHLGLGLYMVKIIVDFHAGEVRAVNLPHGAGVRFEVEIDSAQI
jgi:signal transduction histidine kinase